MVIENCCNGYIDKLNSVEGNVTVKLKVEADKGALIHTLGNTSHEGRAQCTEIEHSSSSCYACSTYQGDTKGQILKPKTESKTIRVLVEFWLLFEHLKETELFRAAVLPKEALSCGYASASAAWQNSSRVVQFMHRGAAVGLSIVCLPFVLPALRRVCLPYVPATTAQVQNVLAGLSGRSGRLVDLGSGDGRIVPTKGGSALSAASSSPAFASWERDSTPSLVNSVRGSLWMVVSSDWGRIRGVLTVTGGCWQRLLDAHSNGLVDSVPLRAFSGLCMRGERGLAAAYPYCYLRPLQVGRFSDCLELGWDFLEVAGVSVNSTILPQGLGDSMAASWSFMMVNATISGYVSVVLLTCTNVLSLVLEDGAKSKGLAEATTRGSSGGVNTAREGTAVAVARRVTRISRVAESSSHKWWSELPEMNCGDQLAFLGCAWLYIPLSVGPLRCGGTGGDELRLVLAAVAAGFQADGVELNPWLVLYSRLQAWQLGMHERAGFLRRDLWQFSLASYSNVVIFGVEEMVGILLVIDQIDIVVLCKSFAQEILCENIMKIP
ncbi:hypothetical protein PR048_024426 [Dryococelus australis]|uniref:Uncharacterized protein n=1 Tax=Dryococelus australis TaxID=614101 RepID=A0ABQ9GNM8_9NEOP|nr:hypothetical protein PR048_024426 [Dryococelus australis]